MLRWWGAAETRSPAKFRLAHNGVLFLDELPEFKRTVLEVMRQPLEERRVTISRAKVSVDFPANFMLVASMNPCPCGYYNHPEKECVCGPGMVQRYLNKVSGPLLDRIDLHVEVTPVSFDEMTANRKAESSKEIRERVIEARQRQQERFKDIPEIYSNALMPSQMVKEVCQINEAGKTLLKTAMERLGLSARAYDRILKVSRTIADLADSEGNQNRASGRSYPVPELRPRRLGRLKWKDFSMEERRGWITVISLPANQEEFMQLQLNLTLTAIFLPAYRKSNS